MKTKEEILKNYRAHRIIATVYGSNKNPTPNYYLKSEALEAMDIYASESAKDNAIGFAEWVNLMDIFMTNEGIWIKNNPEFREKNFTESTSELFDLYTQSKTKEG